MAWIHNERAFIRLGCTIQVVEYRNGRSSPWRRWEPSSFTDHEAECWRSLSVVQKAWRNLGELKRLGSKISKEWQLQQQQSRFIHQPGAKVNRQERASFFSEISLYPGWALWGSISSPQKYPSDLLTGKFLNWFQIQLYLQTRVVISVSEFCSESLS